MKIKSVDKETKKSNNKHLCQIAKAGLGLGITAALINAGVVDYDAMLKWESISDMINQLPIKNLFGADINTVFNLVNAAVTTLGMNNLIIAGKAIGLAQEAVKPIVESEKVQNNPTLLKIKQILKGKDKEPKTPKAFLNLANNGLALGFKTYMVLNGQIDYNSTYDFSKLPHKFLGIAKIAEKIDFNKFKIGSNFLETMTGFISERKAEKEEGLPLIKPITFKEIFEKISKQFPVTTRVSDLNYVTNIGSLQKDISEVSKGVDR